MSAAEKRRIAIDGRIIFRPQCAGIARVIVEMVKAFPVDGTHEIVLVLPSDRTAADVDGLPRHVSVCTTTSRVERPWAVRDLHSTLRRVAADVFFAPYHVLAPRTTPCPQVVGLHDCIIEGDRRLRPNAWWYLAYRLASARALRHATAVVVPSHATQGQLAAFYRVAAPVVVCSNGVDVPAWTAAGAERAAIAGWGLPARYVLHVGARRLHKNHEVLLRALPRLPADVGLVLAGAADPRVADPVDTLAAELGVAHRVISLAGLSDVELRALFAAAAAFAFPSLNEGFGLPPLEAMSAGVPVVASAIPVLAEVCQDAALLVSPYDPEAWAAALTTVITSSDQRDALIARGHEVAAHSGWQVGAAALYDLLTAVARGEQ